MSWVVRAWRTVSALAIVALIVGPVVPGPWAGPLAKQLRRISVIQSWRMYAPDPQRAQSYLALYAELADGSQVPLAEAVAAEQGWGSVWDWQKRRVDIWRAFASGEKPSPHRTWYMRGVCVREARARGEAPVRIVAQRVRRSLTHPDAVAQGKPSLGVLKRTDLQTIRCADWPSRQMLAEDRARRGVEAPG